MVEDERCDEESVVFNTRVQEDEMIINIAEYETMKKCIDTLENEKSALKERLEWSRRNEADTNREMIAMKDKVQAIYNENTLIKQGFINFIKTLGGQNGQIR